MPQPKPETVTLNDVLITEELLQRSPRASNLQAENQAMRSLVQQMVNAPEIMLQSLVDMAVDLCQAGTTGVSLLETTPDGEEIFRWTVLAGTLAQYVGGTSPRDFSPCGICLDRGTPQLYAHPERYFTYIQAANTPFVEGLVLPLIADNHALGTIWIISHCGQRHFDLEDVRIMTSLANFTAAALLLSQRQTQELLVKNAQLEAEVTERKQVEAQLRDVQTRLELSLTGANLGAWTYNVGTDEFWADDRAKSMHGHEVQEVHTFAEAGVNIHPEDGDRAEAFAEAVRTRSKLQIEYRVIWRDGSIHTVASCAEFMQTGEDDGMFYGIAQDISDRVQVEGDRKATSARLRESEARLRGLIENLPGGAVFVVDRDLRYLLAEGEALAIAGFKPEDFVGRTIFEALPPELSAYYEGLYRRALSGKTFEHEHDAHDHTYVSRGIPLRSETDEVDAVLAVSYDISDRKRAEEALRGSEARLAIELADTQQLQRISSQLLQEDDINALYEQILDAAITLMRSDLGSMQMLYPERNELQLLAWKGFNPESVAFWEWVSVDSKTTCGMVLSAGERWIVPDVETCDFMAGTADLDSFRLSGIRAVQSTPLVSRSGNIVGMISTHWRGVHQPSERELRLLDVLARQAADLLEPRRAEEALRESQERLSIAIEAAQMGIWDWDIVNDVATRSLRHDQIFGYDTLQAEWGEKIVKRHVLEEDHEILDAALARARETGKLEFDVRVRWSDGSIHWLADRGRFYFNDDGKAVRAAGVSFDITDHKQAEIDRIQLIREQANRLEVERLNQMKDEFLAMVSHELQSPMVAILGWTRLLRANLPTPETLMKHLETIERNATLQAKLIQDLLDVSRITAGKLRLSLESVDLKSVIEAAIATVGQTAQAKGVDLVWGATSITDENPDFIVMGDCDRLQQVVCNLLTNAIKFTPTAGSVTIELSLTESKNRNGDFFAEIRIIDTGIGISAAFLPHVFDRFRQAEKSGSAGGLGLGLAITQHLTKLHNGTIEAQSAGVGQGATFIILLPLIG